MTQSTVMYIVALSAILLVSLYFQGTLESPTATTSHDSSSSNKNNPSLGTLALDVDVEDVLSKYRLPERRTPLRKDQFWLTESESAYLPFDINFVPPGDEFGKLERLEWSCSEANDNSGDSRKISGRVSGQKRKLIFVHPVRTEAFVVNDLISSYALYCPFGYASVAMCSGLSWESMISSTWANRRAPGAEKGVRCRIESANDRQGQVVKGMKYVETSFLKSSVDALVGQIPMGSHQKWNENANDNIVPQYIVSLRCPFAWFLSSMFDKVMVQKKEDLPLQQNNTFATGDGHLVDDVIKVIKEKVQGDLSSNVYHEAYARYLITPSQISWIQKEQADIGIEHRVNLSLRNIVENNAVLVITERLMESLEVLEYLIDAKCQYAKCQYEGIFARAKRKLEKRQQNTEHDGPNARSLPTVEVLLEKLKQDEELYEEVKKYLKYESKIYREALKMHSRQLAWVRERRSSQ